MFPNIEQQENCSNLRQLVKTKQMALRMCIVLFTRKSTVAVHYKRNMTRYAASAKNIVTKPMYKGLIVFTNPRHSLEICFQVLPEKCKKQHECSHNVNTEA